MARSRKDDVRSKGERQQAILRLVREYPISRQEVLLDYLSKEGFEVTQATVSRDIRELCLVKAATAEGYAMFPAGTKALTPRHRAVLKRSFMNLCWAWIMPGMLYW